MKDLINNIIKKVYKEDSYNWNSSIKQLSVSNNEMVYIGWVTHYEYLNGYGFVADLFNNEKHFFHASEIGEDFFSTEHSSTKTKKNVLFYIHQELRGLTTRDEEYKKAQTEMREKNVEKMEVTLRSRFGLYSVLVEKGDRYPELISADISGFPYIRHEDIVCFRIKDKRAVSLHKPAFYKMHFLQNKNNYSSNHWVLLYNFIPSILQSIHYEGLDNIEDYLIEFRQKSLSTIQRIKNMDIKPYFNKDNYGIGLRIDYFPTTKDLDPNQLELILYKKSNELTDDFLIPLRSLYISENVDYYGRAPLSHLKNCVYEDYRKVFDDFYTEYSSDEYQNGKTDLVEKHFSHIKDEWLKDLDISHYSQTNHIKHYIEIIKYQIVNTLKNRMFFTRELISTDANRECFFKFENGLKYYGNRIKFVFHNYGEDNGISYELYTYDDKKYEHYKKMSEIHYQVDDKDYKKTSDIEKLNKELRQYVDSLFNEEMEKIIKEQCDS